MQREELQFPPPVINSVIAHSSIFPHHFTIRPLSSLCATKGPSRNCCESMARILSFMISASTH